MMLMRALQQPKIYLKITEGNSSALKSQHLGIESKKKSHFSHDQCIWSSRGSCNIVLQKCYENVMMGILFPKIFELLYGKW